jgi:hypothetical protein
MAKDGRMYTKDISTNVTLFAEDINGYCGEANAQMVRDGYPNPADRLYYRQDFLENIICLYNSHRSEDRRKYSTDPEGMQGCLQSLSSYPVKWMVFTSSDRDEANRFILISMNDLSFPTPVLVNSGGHWVVVVRFETDVDPSSSAKAKLEYITMYDPDMPGSITTKTATQWNRNSWFGAVKIPGTWKDRFVVVGQTV